MEDYRVVGIVGGGTMGAGIAYEVVRTTGARVIVRDVSDEQLARARASLERFVERPVAKGQITREQADAWLARLAYTTDFTELAPAQVVVEAVFEDLAVKRDVFQTLGSVCQPDALLASNTSGLSITSIAAACAVPERVIGLHFFNPVPAMKLVEIVRAYQTSDATVARAQAFCAALGKETVLAKDFPGFITTRVGMAMVAEGIRCLEEGVASAQDIDTAIRLGYNFPMGPLELADLVGLDVLLHILEDSREALGERFMPSPLLRQMVAAGHLGRKSGRGFYDYSAK
jgi:3-hydroxybutyryl-CoA dehydrogenase